MPFEETLRQAQGERDLKQYFCGILVDTNLFNLNIKSVRPEPVEGFLRTRVKINVTTEERLSDFAGCKFS